MSSLPKTNGQTAVKAPKKDSSSTNSNGSSSKKTEKSKKTSKTPQSEMTAFWNRFFTKYPGIAYSVLPFTNEHAALAAKRERFKEPCTKNAQLSYDDAVAVCRTRVEKIVEQCRRINQKFTDTHFDIEYDMLRKYDDCLKRLNEDDSKYSPGCVKRIPEIFDKPDFYFKGSTGADIRQGKDVGDCWFLAATCALINDRAALDRICVAKDTDVGVYGFVFFRDGEWISEVVDDKLYLTKKDYSELTDEEKNKFTETFRADARKDWREQMQNGSSALYFSSCKDPNATWLPVLEKAYAKAHGDFSAIHGGYFGEAIEDLTGGVTDEVGLADIMDKERFWREELQQVGKDFHFGASAGLYSQNSKNRGIHYKHCYTVEGTAEIDGVKLVKLRNPWGRSEWKGPWSDGSEEWTPARMTKLEHKFGDDGLFWMPYDYFCSTFDNLDRTRLFGKDWSQTQLWTSLQVPWTAEYLNTKFSMTISKKTSIVLVLSQLDRRYFWGLEGPYIFYLQFRLHKKGDQNYIVQNRKRYHMRRSVDAEIENLEPGKYSIRIKIFAIKQTDVSTAQETVEKVVSTRRNKLLNIALQYEIAFAKAQIPEKEKEEEEEAAEREKENKRAEKERQRRVKKKSKLRKQRREILDKERKARKEQKKAESSSKAEKQEDQKLVNGVNGVDGSDDADSESDEIPVQEQQEDEDSETNMVNGNNDDSSLDGHKEHPKMNGHVENHVESDEPNSEEIKRLTLDDISDSELSWDSDIDGPYEEPGEEDSSKADQKTTDSSETESSPWNAVVVVGLRVYSKNTKDGDVRISITNEDTEDQEKALDLEHSARDQLEKSQE